MTSTVIAPAGSPTRPGWPDPVIDPRWVEHGLRVAERTVGIALTADPDGLAEFGASVAKVVAESAILLRILRPHHDSVRFRQLDTRLGEVARDPRTLTALALHASASFELAVPYLVLREHRSESKVDALLRTAFAARAARGRELVPHRALERIWLKGLLTGAAKITGADLDATVLAHEIDLLHGTRDDHYAFTHALMYATDFGRHPEGVPRAWVPRLLDQARSALAGALDDDDHDIAGELLLSWPLLAADAGPVESAALRVLVDVAEAVGTLPSLTLGIDTPSDTLDPGDRVVLSTYHTSFVFAALAALAPTVRWADPCTDGVRLASSWPTTGRRPGWLEVPAAQLCAEPLGLEATLRRAIRSHRLSEVPGLLGPGTPATPLTRQALELLERLTLL